MGFEGTPDIADIAKAGEVGTKALDTFGRIFPGWTASSLSRAESRSTDRMLRDLEKIKERGAEIGLSTESINELMTNAVKRHSRNVNFDSILALAAPMVSEGSDSSAVDREWAEHFRDHAEKVSEKEVATIWAQLLAQEVNEPGSVSKRTMSTLADMNPDDARVFSDLCTMCVLPFNGKFAEWSPLVILEKDGSGATFNDGTFDYGRRSQLELFGLIDSSIRESYTIEPKNTMQFIIGHELISVENRSENSIELGTSPVLTRIGTELARLCEIGTCEGLGTIFAKKAEDCGLVSYSKTQRIRVSDR